MTQQQFEQMDPYIALSLVNMKLRDVYHNIERLVDDWGIDEDVIHDKFKQIGYIYHHEHHQFVSVDAS